MSGVKCINKIKKILCIFLTLVVFLTGCTSIPIQMSYDPEYQVGCFRMDVSVSGSKLDTFSKNLCVSNEEIYGDLETVITEPEAAGLFSVNDASVLYAKNIHEQLDPASLTKILTAIVALKYGNLEDEVVIGDEIEGLESDAQTCGLEEGDVVTMSQLLYVLLIWSANDAALSIAKHVGGSVDQFVEMMNEEALRVGATNSHFMNPHGLTEENHYITLYDLYLIFNEALSYSVFRDIIQCATYKSVYQDKDGNEKSFDVLSTNLYLRGDVETPDTVRVAGGKTGTTYAAGNCLLIYGLDSINREYIAIMLNSASKQIMYEQMTDLLKEIGK